MAVVDIAFPVYHGNLNQIEATVTQVTDFCQKNLLQYDWKLILGINGPRPEKVLALCEKLEKTNKSLYHLYVATPGKGAGLNLVWKNSKADIVAYMDVDLSVDIAALPVLLDGVREHDICVGSRYHKDSRVERGLMRKCASWFYHRIVQQVLLGTKCEDLHCGFKAFRRDVAQRILPYVQDPGWYFDSEIMSLAERLGYSIKTIPVVWDEGKVSGLVLKRVIPAFFLKTIELKLRQLPEEARKYESH